MKCKLEKEEMQVRYEKPIMEIVVFNENESISTGLGWASSGTGETHNPLGKSTIEDGPNF